MPAPALGDPRHRRVQRVEPCAVGGKHAAYRVPRAGPAASGNTATMRGHTWRGATASSAAPIPAARRPVRAAGTTTGSPRQATLSTTPRPRPSAAAGGPPGSGQLQTRTCAGSASQSFRANSAATARRNLPQADCRRGQHPWCTWRGPLRYPSKRTGRSEHPYPPERFGPGDGGTLFAAKHDVQTAGMTSPSTCQKIKYSHAATRRNHAHPQIIDVQRPQPEFWNSAGFLLDPNGVVPLPMLHFISSESRRLSAVRVAAASR